MVAKSVRQHAGYVCPLGVNHAHLGFQLVQQTGSQQPVPEMVGTCAATRSSAALHDVL